MASDGENYVCVKAEYSVRSSECDCKQQSKRGGSATVTLNARNIISQFYSATIFVADKI
jgi:hypothetical protein